MGLIDAARLLVGTWLILSLLVFVLMLSGFKPQQALLLTPWVAAPLPVAYWLGAEVARTPAAWAALVGGLAATFAFGAYLYWDAFLGPSSRTESLSGLIVLFAPLYQLAALAIAVLAAWLLSRPRP